MNIQENQKRRVAFSELGKGECFKWEGSYFVKTEDTTIADKLTDRYVNCVNLKSGEFDYCGETYVYNPVVNIAVIE